MRYPAAEKLEIIRLVEGSHLPVAGPMARESVVPAVEGRTGTPIRAESGAPADAILRPPDDLELLGGGVSHSRSPPAPVMLFLSSRFSSVRSATASFSAAASARSSFTSGLVAWRAVSPARRRLPASRNSFDQL